MSENKQRDQLIKQSSEFFVGLMKRNLEKPIEASQRENIITEINKEIIEYITKTLFTKEIDLDVTLDDEYIANIAWLAYSLHSQFYLMVIQTLVNCEDKNDKSWMELDQNDIETFLTKIKDAKNDTSNRCYRFRAIFSVMETIAAAMQDIILNMGEQLFNKEHITKWFSTRFIACDAIKEFDDIFKDEKLLHLVISGDPMIFFIFSQLIVSIDKRLK